MRICDNGHAWACQKRRNLGPCPAQQIRPDAHVIGAVAQWHMNGFGHSVTSNTSGRVRNASITRPAMSSIDSPAADTTFRSASA